MRLRCRSSHDWTPIVFAFVLGLSFILLLLAFRSIVVPLKAIMMNLLSVGAAYGLLVLVFQKGYLHGFFGFQPDADDRELDPDLPLLRALRAQHGLPRLPAQPHPRALRRHATTTSESVAVGLQSTGADHHRRGADHGCGLRRLRRRQLVMLQQMGFGLAVAVLLDATIVRSILVPASMALLGDRNWYLPNWLGWLPNLHVEGEAAPALRLPVTQLPASVSGDD